MSRMPSGGTYVTGWFAPCLGSVFIAAARGLCSVPTLRSESASPRPESPPHLGLHSLDLGKPHRVVWQPGKAVPPPALRKAHTTRLGSASRVQRVRAISAAAMQSTSSRPGSAPTAVRGVLSGIGSRPATFRRLASSMEPDLAPLAFDRDPQIARPVTVASSSSKFMQHDGPSRDERHHQLAATLLGKLPIIPIGPKTTVEIDPQGAIICFTRWVSHATPCDELRSSMS